MRAVTPGDNVRPTGLRVEVDFVEEWEAFAQLPKWARALLRESPFEFPATTIRDVLEELRSMGCSDEERQYHLRNMFRQNEAIKRAEHKQLYLDLIEELKSERATRMSNAFQRAFRNTN